MKFEEFNRIYAPRQYQLELRLDLKGQKQYLRLLDYEQDQQLAKLPFPDRTADLPEDFLRYVNTLPRGDLST